MRFFKCAKCGTILPIAEDVDLSAKCGDFVEVSPNTTEAAVEKHVPVVKVEGNIVKVTVGEVLHPMQDAHYIGWIMLQTKFGNQRRVLKPGDEPVVEFAILPEDEVIRVISYCNLHGLWSTK
ncbi:MAG: desulfoferrodoxin Dfx [Erysipelotrichales bacterium]|nr:desulfoferrodoxin Dfx [Erysipelotrichales bacterium]